MDGYRGAGNLLEAQQMGIDPFQVGFFGGKTVLYFGIAQQFARSGIDGNHFAGCQSPFLDDLGVIDFVAANLRAQADEPVFGDFVPCWSESISIQTSRDNDSVGKYQTRRPIPRFGETPM